MTLSAADAQRLLDGAAPRPCPLCGGLRQETCASVCGASDPPGTWPGFGAKALSDAAADLAESLVAVYAALERERATATRDAKVCVDEILVLVAERDAAREEAQCLRDRATVSTRVVE